MSRCNYQWSEVVKYDTRNGGVHDVTLTHVCIEVRGHALLTRPLPHRCTCDPVPELREDYEFGRER